MASAWLALAATLTAAPAAAQGDVAASFSLQSNQIFRGETISADDPGLSAAISIDGPAGFFAGADVSVAAGGEDPRVTNFSQYAGYAQRLGRTSIEIGVIHRRYLPVYDTDYNRDYFEGYVGLTRGKSKLRVYASTDYLIDGRLSFYGEFDTKLMSLGKWSVDGHAGLSVLPQDVGSGLNGPRIYEDWRLSVGREWRGFGVSLGVAGSNYPVIGPSGDARVFASISRAF